MDILKLRAWWFHRQGLDGSCPVDAIGETLTRYGWSRSVGGSSPYLGIFARSGARRAAVDAALERMDIHELPSARGCTHVVAAPDYGLALRICAASGDGERKLALKLGVTEKEIATLSKAVVKTLEASGPLDPDGLKKALGAKVRNLGEEGKKKGLTTTLPVSLGELQAAGEIRRIPVDGRLDQQRYRYAAWRPNPLAGYPASTPAADFTSLARRYFEWIGPATLNEFRWFSGLGATAAKAAIEPLGLSDIGDGRLLPPDLADAFHTFTPPREARIALLGSIDSMILLRRDLTSLMDDEKVAGLGGVADLPSHAILDRGTLVGLWEYDPTQQNIAWSLFAKAPAAAVKAAVARMEAFIGEDLGDARSFSLDSPKSRQPRIDALRAK